MNTFYINNPKIEWLYQKSGVVQEFILFKILRLRKHPNTIGIHFYLPLEAYHVFTLDLYLIRLNLFFPLFLSFSIGRLGKIGFQFYIGIKYDPTASIINEELDYTLSIAGRKIPLEKSNKIKQEASF